MRTSKPRLIVEITPRQQETLTKYLAYGERRRVFQAILKDIVVLLDEFGYDFVAFMLQREFSYRHLMEDYADKRFANPVTNINDR